MTVEERTARANVRIMNDRIRKQCFMNYEQFADKIKEELPGLQIEIHKVLIPVIYAYNKIEGRNYYTDFIKLRFGL